jgi:hypothetical protein
MCVRFVLGAAGRGRDVRPICTRGERGEGPSGASRSTKRPVRNSGVTCKPHRFVRHGARAGLHDRLHDRRRARGAGHAARGAGRGGAHIDHAESAVDSRLYRRVKRRGELSLVGGGGERRAWGKKERRWPLHPICTGRGRDVRPVCTGRGKDVRPICTGREGGRSVRFVLGEGRGGDPACSSRPPDTSALPSSAAGGGAPGSPSLKLRAMTCAGSHRIIN